MLKGDMIYIFQYMREFSRNFPFVKTDLLQHCNIGDGSDDPGDVVRGAVR